MLKEEQHKKEHYQTEELDYIRETCPDCKGSGADTDGQTCSSCNGKGAL